MHSPEDEQKIVDALIRYAQATVAIATDVAINTSATKNKELTTSSRVLYKKIFGKNPDEEKLLRMDVLR